MIVTGIFATSSKDSDGDIFTRDALETMVAEAPKKPVTVEFITSYVGTCIEASIDRGKAVGVFEVQAEQRELIEALRDGRVLYIVPGGFCNPNEWEEFPPNGREYFNFHITSFGITIKPADRTLTPIRVVDAG